MNPYLHFEALPFTDVIGHAVIHRAESAVRLGKTAGLALELFSHAVEFGYILSGHLTPAFLTADSYPVRVELPHVTTWKEEYPA